MWYVSVWTYPAESAARPVAAANQQEAQGIRGRKPLSSGEGTQHIDRNTVW